jgi:hypothetical protein
MRTVLPFHNRRRVELARFVLEHHDDIVRSQGKTDLYPVRRLAGVAVPNRVHDDLLEHEFRIVDTASADSLFLEKSAQVSLPACQIGGVRCEV